MAKSKKKNKKRSGSPKPAGSAQTAQAQEQQEEKKVYAQPAGYRSDKPLYLRIIMLAIAAVMILGIVIGAVAGNAGAF